METEIIRLEEELRQAIIDSDIEKLNELIDDSLVFIAHDGSVAVKQMDIQAHESGIEKIVELTPSEQNITILDKLAIVSVKMNLKGRFLDSDITGDYRYLRIWNKKENKWKIIAGSVTKIPE